MFEFSITAFSLGVKEGEGWTGEEILYDLVMLSSAMAETILSIPLLSAHFNGKLFNSANQWGLIWVGKTIPSYLEETVEVSLSHLLFTVLKVTHGIGTRNSLSKRTSHSTFPYVVIHVFFQKTKPREKVLFSFVLIPSSANRENCWSTSQLNQWEGNASATKVICCGRFPATWMLLGAQFVSLLILQECQVQGFTDCSSYACLSQTANNQALMMTENKQLPILLLAAITVPETPLHWCSPLILSALLSLPLVPDSCRSNYTALCLFRICSAQV